MTYIIVEARDGMQPVGATEAVQQHPLGTIVRAQDAKYGAGEFVYLRGVADTSVGTWAVYSEDDYATALLGSDMIGQVAVAMSPNVAGRFGWYHIKGKAVGKCLPAYCDNGLVYATATFGSVDDACVAGDRVKRALGASEADVPGPGLAEFEIDRPFADDGSMA